MSQEAQAFGEMDRRLRPSRSLAIALACFAVLPLTACAGGVGLGKAAIDDTLTTNAVATQRPKTPDAVQTSDEATIRNAVSAADLEASSNIGLPWANVDTGSRGAITDLVEYDRKGILCRKFRASRESFNGVRLYTGDACRAGDGSWRMLAFDETRG